MKKAFYSFIALTLFLSSCQNVTPPNALDGTAQLDSPTSQSTSPSELKPQKKITLKGQILGPDKNPLPQALILIQSPNLAGGNFTPTGADILLLSNDKGEFEQALSIHEGGTLQLKVSKLGYGTQILKINDTDQLSLKVTFSQRENTLPGKVLYTRRHRVHPQIFLMTTDGTGNQYLADGYSAQWGPTGKYLTFLKQDGVYTVNEDGSKLFQAWTGKDAVSTVFNPAGTQLAFSARKDLYNHDIFTLNSDGSDLKQITSHAAPETVSDWQSNSLLFGSTQATPVPESQGGPSGTSGFFDGQADIYKISDSAKDQKQLSKSGVSDSHARYSPDGKQIAFIRSGILMLMNADGSGVTQLSDLGYSKSNEQITIGGTVRGPLAWSNDGKHIMATRIQKLCECPEAKLSDAYIYSVDKKDLYRVTFSGDVLGVDWYQSPF